ncbi:hypothetical protein ACMT1E_02620 [Sphingomonas flavalba]|uniref:hypothetical protein n=1 Tax=Sphingomonas flavalba TaxID=2559804 RepID=UPI0039E1D86A
MYSESDLDGAVAAGAISAETAAALRAHVEARRAAPLVDEEHFRLISGFNDIFVAIAGGLLLVAVGWLGRSVMPWLGSAAVAGAAWGLAEYFTRQRRMALPSILFLLAFVGGVFATATTLLGIGDGGGPDGDSAGALLFALSGAIAAGAAWLHWRRFRVPITVAAGAGALVAMLFGLLFAVVPEFGGFGMLALFASGLAVFALAMWWDMSDRLRQTRRSDVAFWLHLLAAPMLVHPVFQALGVLDNKATMVTGVVVLLLYAAIGAVALAIDRRALMVSALAYVIAALSGLVRDLGAISLSTAITALIIGSALLLLSAFWHGARAAVLGLLPPELRDRLPPAGATVVSARTGAA